jgi:hypothetical protein
MIDRAISLISLALGVLALTPVTNIQKNIRYGAAAILFVFAAAAFFLPTERRATPAAAIQAGPEACVVQGDHNQVKCDGSKERPFPNASYCPPDANIVAYNYIDHTGTIFRDPSNHRPICYIGNTISQSPGPLIDTGPR